MNAKEDNKGKELIAFSLVIACGVAFICIFVSILLTGGYMAVEPNIYILWAEIAGSLFIFGFGIYGFIEKLRRIK